MLKIAHINLFDYQGGAAKLAWTIMESMTALGHDIRIFAHRKTTQDPRIVQIPFPAVGWQKELLIKQQEQGLFDLYSAALLGVLQHPFFQEADLVHLHCINGNYFSFLLLPFLTALKPTVWTLHDPMAFTGGCYHTDYCDHWQDMACQNCPLDEKAPGVLQRPMVQQLKTAVYQLADFALVSPSQWLKTQTEASILQDHAVRLIHNGIDTDVFQPGNRTALREKLGLPADKPILMFAAHGGFNERRKGGNFLIQALTALHQRYPDLTLLNIGTYDQTALAGLPTARIDIPFVNDQHRLAEYYAASDLFASPSLSENLSLTICEAMACGTPVIAFPAGGTPEVVTHQENGYLARMSDSEDLAAGIAFFLEDPARLDRAGQAARLHIVDHFSARRMVDEYTELYEELLAQKAPPTGITPNEKSSNPYDGKALLEHYRIPALVEVAKSRGWGNVWQQFTAARQELSLRLPEEQALFTDLFAIYCLRSIDPQQQGILLIDNIGFWLSQRRPQDSPAALPLKEQQALAHCCRIVRERLAEFFWATPLQQVGSLDQRRQAILIALWRHIVLNPVSSLHRPPAGIDMHPGRIRRFLSEQEPLPAYPGLLIAALYGKAASNNKPPTPEMLQDNKNGRAFWQFVWAVYRKSVEK